MSSIEVYDGLAEPDKYSSLLLAVPIIDDLISEDFVKGDCYYLHEKPEVKVVDAGEFRTPWLPPLTKEVYQRIYWIPSLLRGSEISGSTISLANLKYAEKKWYQVDGVYFLTGAYKTYGVAFRFYDLVTNNDILESLLGLRDYQILEDEELSNLESEIAYDLWVRKYRRELRRELLKKFKNKPIRISTTFGRKGSLKSFLTDDVLDEILRNLDDNCTVEWLPIKDDPFNLEWDIDKAAGVVTVDLIFDAIRNVSR